MGEREREMDGWIEGWRDGGMHAWKGRCMDGRIDEQLADGWWDWQMADGRTISTLSNILPGKGMVWEDLELCLSINSEDVIPAVAFSQWETFLDYHQAVWDKCEISTCPQHHSIDMICATWCPEGKNTEKMLTVDSISVVTTRKTFRFHRAKKPSCGCW